MKLLGSRRRTAALAGLTTTILLFTAACADDDDEAQSTATAPATAATSPATLEVTATDYAFEVGAANVAAGPVQIALVNRGAEDHHLTLARVNDGAQADDVLAALRNGDESAMAKVTPVGGPNGAAPGTTRRVITTLAPGAYVMMCHIPSPTDRVPHLAKGMVGSFTVSAATGTPVATPAAKGTITIGRGGYQVPANLGSGTYQVVNELDQPAEATVVRLRQGASARDVMAFLGGQAPPGPPPFSVAGGVTTLAPRGSSLVDLDLGAGTYALLSFSPDRSAGGRPQFLSGLLTEVKVA